MIPLHRACKGCGDWTPSPRPRCSCCYTSWETTTCFWILVARGEAKTWCELTLMVYVGLELVGIWTLPQVRFWGERCKMEGMQKVPLSSWPLAPPWWGGVVQSVHWTLVLYAGSCLALLAGSEAGSHGCATH